MTALAAEFSNQSFFSHRLLTEKVEFPFTFCMLHLQFSQTGWSDSVCCHKTTNANTRGGGGKVVASFGSSMV